MEPVQVPFSSLSANAGVAVFLQQFNATFADDDQNVKSSEVGCNSWSVSANTVNLAKLGAFLSDNSGHYQDDTVWSVTALVIVTQPAS